MADWTIKISSLAPFAGTPIRSLHSLQLDNGQTVIRSNKFNVDNDIIFKCENMAKTLDDRLSSMARHQHATENADAYDLDFLYASHHRTFLRINDDGDKACLEISGISVADFERALNLPEGHIKHAKKSAHRGNRQRLDRENDLAV